MDVELKTSVSYDLTQVYFLKLSKILLLIFQYKVSATVRKTITTGVIMELVHFHQAATSFQYIFLIIFQEYGRTLQRLH